MSSACANGKQIKQDELQKKIRKERKRISFTYNVGTPFMTTEIAMIGHLLSGTAETRTMCNRH